MKRLIPMLALVLVVQSCNDDDIVCGGECKYDTIPGTAVIGVIAPDTLDARICENAVFVYFDFAPADTNAPDHYKFPNWPDTDRRIFVGDGKNPPSSWLEAKGLDVGTVHDCVRLEETKGTCTPVLFRFSKVDYSGWPAYCEPRQ
ncbi:MAG: hypothetical protein P8181_00635 [bacterium]